MAKGNWCFKKRDLVIAVLFLFLLVRIFLIFCSSCVYLLEEEKQASLGIDFLRGKLTLPFWCYLDSPHSGGSILTSLTLIPFFILFGQKYLALKISALVYSFGTIIIICFLLKKYYNFKKIFYPLTIFFVLSTPHYLQKSLSLFGNTVEFLLLGMLFIWLINRALIEKKEERKFSYLIIGVVGGLGFWVQYLFLIFLVAFVVFLIFENGLSIFKYKFWQFFAGFCLGFSPWLIYNILYGFPSIYADARVTSHIVKGITGLFFINSYVFFELLLTEIPRSFHFLPLYTVSPKLIAYFFYILFWASLFYLLFLRKIDNHKRKFHLFLISLFLFSIFCFSILPFPIGNTESLWGSMNYHFEFYILFLQPIMFMIMIMAYAELDKRKLCVFLRLGYYALFPIILLQFFQVLDCPNFKNKVNMDLSNHKAVGNAFESGFNFSLSHSIWEKVLAEIEDRNCRISYLKGTVDSHMPAGYLALSKLSQEEKKIFLKYTEKQSSLNMSKD